MGPFKMLERGPKFFMLLLVVGIRREAVTMHRFCTANMDLAVLPCCGHSPAIQLVAASQLLASLLLSSSPEAITAQPAPSQVLPQANQAASNSPMPS